MKNFFIILLLGMFFAGCTSQRNAAYFTSNQRKEQGSFIERVKDVFKRKPMSQRRKYKKPMKTTCYVFIESQGFDKNVFKTIKNSDCDKYIYGMK